MAASVGEMVAQSRDILTHRSVATIEKYEKAGGIQQALIYVGIAAAITGIFGLFGGITGFIGSILSTLLGFFVFTYLVYWIGKQQGGTGTFDEVAYSFALFYAPISVLSAAIGLVLAITIVGLFLLPLLLILTMVANIYFAYVAAQSSLNLAPGGKIWLVLILAGLGSVLVSGIIGSIFGTTFNFNANSEALLPLLRSILA